MSQDKFWEQFAAGSGKTEEPAKPSEAAAGDPNNVDSDVLAAWLTSLPGDDPIVNRPQPEAPAAPSPSPAELAELWPPAAPVDPFTGIHKPSGDSSASEWDLAFDPTPTVIAPAVEPSPPPPAPAEVAAPPAGAVSDFELGGLPGLAPPAANPFAPDAPAAPPVPAPAITPELPPAPPAASPFGPPPPPVAPPAEALQAAPLKLAITSGRRTNELVIQGEALIGRPDATRGLHPEIDLRLDDAVSRRHAKIFVRNGHYVLTDLNSTNGTRHNQQWVQPEVEVPLSPGDEIEVGEITLIRVLEAPAADA